MTSSTTAQPDSAQPGSAQPASAQPDSAQPAAARPVPAGGAPALSDEAALAAARSLAPLVSPQDAAGHLAAGGLLLDVRSAAGRASTGSIEGARITDRNDLGPELDPTAHPDAHGSAGEAAGEAAGAAGAAAVDGARLPVSLDTPIVVVCGSERGSGTVAAELIARGYTDVRQVDGGAPGWAAAGLPLTR